MTKNPFLNALAAGLYIVAIVLIMNTASSLATLKGGNILVPMVVLGLFVLSAAVMGLLFLYQPFRLSTEGKMQEALRFFAKTLGTFAALVAALVIVLFLFFALR